MKLAHKYEMDTIREQAVQTIRGDWPETFEQWARIDAEISVMDRLHAIAQDRLIDGKTLIDRTPEAGAAIRFARDFNIPSILPAIYYALAHSDRCWHWSLRNQYPMHEREYLRFTRWEMLDHTDFKVVLCLRTLLISKLSNVASQYSGKTDGFPVGKLTVCPATPTESHANCATGLAQILQRWKDNELDLGNMLAAAQDPDPLELLGKLHRMHSTANMCDRCKNRLGHHITMYQDDLWEQVVGMTETYLEDVQ